MKILNVAGARPNFIKIAPIMDALGERRGCDALLVHTGQHYDERMSDLFFRQLGIPPPDVDLEVGSSTHARQTADIMRAFEPVVLQHRPDAVLVVGDVNSTVACGLVAVKLGIPLVHVEAGLRSFDRAMPEEVNRVVTDAISNLLFCTEERGVENLLREGIARERIFLVGNVMIDTLKRNLGRAGNSTILRDLSLVRGQFALVTLHRPSNVDTHTVLSGIVDALEDISKDLPIVFPVHPRTRRNLGNSDLAGRISRMPNLKLLDPIGYLDFLRLMSTAAVVLTDSGGIQEETTILRVPCLTLRHSTERPVTVELGSNQIVGTDPDRILEGYRACRSGRTREPRTPPLWDGSAAKRIVEILLERL